VTDNVFLAMRIHSMVRHPGLYRITFDDGFTITAAVKGMLPSGIDTVIFGNKTEMNVIITEIDKIAGVQRYVDSQEV